MLPPCVCFHIEHSLGSGWTPEGEKKLFARLEEKKILNPSWQVLYPIVEGMLLRELPVSLNGPSWGLADFELPVEPLLRGKIVAGPVHPQPYCAAPANLPVSALRPEFDLDHLTRLYRLISHRLAKQIKDYQDAVKRSEEYLKIVDKDRDDRLASIIFYQDKLKVAQADHEHNLAYIKQLEGNVPYLKQLEAEIAALKQAGTEKDARIADLTARARGPGPGHS